MRIGSYLEIEKTDYTQPPRFTWKQFYDFRNHVLQVLERFGSVGPCGQVGLSADDEEPPVFARGERHPDFFVVDDMYNKHDQLSIVECNVKLVSADLVRSLAEMASRFPGWYVAMNVGDSGLRVFGDRVLTGGRRFWDCKTVEEIGTRCSAPVDYGVPSPAAHTMYPLWLNVICGEYPAQRYREAPDREWREVVAILQAIYRSDSNNAKLDASNYDRIRYDLHPQTRREFAVRVLLEAETLSAAQFAKAKRHIQREAADALALPSVHDRRRLATAVSGAQIAAEHLLEAKDVLFWWPYIIDAIKQPDDSLHSILIAELRNVADSATGWTQLSAVFALSRLHAGDLTGIIDRAIGGNQIWLQSDSLINWLMKLRKGSVAYPSSLVLP